MRVQTGRLGADFVDWAEDREDGEVAGKEMSLLEVKQEKVSRAQKHKKA